MRTRGRVITIPLLLLLGLALAGCQRSTVPEKPIMTIYIDATRGCTAPESPVMYWQRPGVEFMKEGVGEIPHGTRVDAFATREQVGVNYYLVEYGGKQGWLSEDYISEQPPSCD